MKAREFLCYACELEAELGTQNVPHPIDGRVHTCSTALDPDAPDPILALQKEIEHERTRADTAEAELVRCVMLVTAKMLALRLDIDDQRARKALADLVVAMRLDAGIARPNPNVE